MFTFTYVQAQRSGFRIQLINRNSPDRIRSSLEGWDEGEVSDGSDIVARSCSVWTQVKSCHLL